MYTESLSPPSISIPLSSSADSADDCQSSVNIARYIKGEAPCRLTGEVYCK